MNKLTLYNALGDKTGDVEFPEQLLVRRRGAQAVHDAVVAYLANQRLGTAKTKLLAAALKKMNVTRGALLVTADVSRNLALAARNLSGVAVAAASRVNTYQVLRYPHLVVSQAALTQLQQRITLPQRRAS